VPADEHTEPTQQLEADAQRDGPSTLEQPLAGAGVPAAGANAPEAGDGDAAETTGRADAGRAGGESEVIESGDEPMVGTAAIEEALAAGERLHAAEILPGTPDAIEFIEVYKSFGSNQVLRGLNMAIPEGHISMIIGPSGTGKSVCIKHIVGLLYPDQGDVVVQGQSVPSLPDEELFEMRRKFGVLFQDGALFGSLSLYDNVAFPLRQHTEKGEDEIEEIVNRRLGEVGLGGEGHKMPNELSGGMRKRAGFARSLVLDPRIVLFDEPDSGIDPVRTALLCELIKEVHETNGGTYVVITHDILSARRIASYLVILWQGKVVEQGPAQKLFESDNPFTSQFLSGNPKGPLGMVE
jgi:phospholipid/cholesterol/gamma-HCH transport system ATP-binding protein